MSEPTHAVVRLDVMGFAGLGTGLLNYIRVDGALEVGVRCGAVVLANQPDIDLIKFVAFDPCHYTFSTAA